MIRRIHCEECDRMTRPQHNEDVALGWKRRRVQIRAKKPEVHEIKVLSGKSIESLAPTKTITLASLMCDGCGAPLEDGTPAFALTEWQESREGEPGPWEKDYSR